MGENIELCRGRKIIFRLGKQAQVGKPNNAATPIYKEKPE
jgi:hypothetical protein